MVRIRVSGGRDRRIRLVGKRDRREEAFLWCAKRKAMVDVGEDDVDVDDGRGRNGNQQVRVLMLDGETGIMGSATILRFGFGFEFVIELGHRR